MTIILFYNYLIQ